MAAEITCPNCGHQFEPNEAIRDEVEKELRSKINDWSAAQSCIRPTSFARFNSPATIR